MVKDKIHNDASKYLSLKRIAILSLSISLGFHFMFMLVFFFGNSLIDGPEKTVEQRHDMPRLSQGHEADTLHLGQAPLDVPRHDAPPKPDETETGRKKFRFDRILVQSLFSFVMLFVLFLYNRRIMGIKFRKKGYELFFVILGSLLITTVLSITFSFLPSLFDAHKPGLHFRLRIMRDSLIRDYTLMAIVIMACNLVRSLYRQRTMAVENETLRTENIRSRYDSLKSQLDPHFLFNSMNALQSLIELDTEKAGDYVQQLSSVLRYTLQNKELVTLAEEMDCVQAYCGMMQIRFGDNLRIDFQVDSRYDSYKVFPLSVQGLVENAIKHNVVSARQPLSVSICTHDDDTLSVSNAIQSKAKDEGDMGIGLANLAERYRLQWDREIHVMDDGRRFEVILPLIRN